MAPLAAASHLPEFHALLRLLKFAGGVELGYAELDQIDHVDHPRSSAIPIFLQRRFGVSEIGQCGDSRRKDLPCAKVPNPLKKHTLSILWFHQFLAVGRGRPDGFEVAQAAQINRR